MAGEFQVTGTNAQALFKLKVHRGEGMVLLAMNWKVGKPPKDFVGFAIQYKEPGSDRFLNVRNRLAFAGVDGSVNPTSLSTMLSPIQMFRWIHFPFNAEQPGEFLYRVTPVFMSAQDELSYGEAQEAAIELRRETYPGLLNVTFTRGFVASQRFVDTYEAFGSIDTLLPEQADKGLDFVPTHPKAAEALNWMGFEARRAILDVLDEAIADKKAEVRVVAYDLSQADVVSRLEQLGARLKIIIDDDGPHGKKTSGETLSAQRLAVSAGAQNVKRQHMGALQHNKTIVVDGPKARKVVCGSTNFTWRGFFVQSNNALVLQGKTPVKVFKEAFDHYWDNDTPATFGKTASAVWTKLGLKGIDAQVAFSPHIAKNAVLKSVGTDIASASSSLLYSLAFLAITGGAVKDAIKKVSNDKTVFVYGMADAKVGGLVLVTPDGNPEPVSPASLKKNAPEPFKAEPTGGGGNRMHHKFVVIDFDKPTARVYMGSYNFSNPADVSNGENLLLIRDRRVAVAYAIEALRIFDHYHFRVKQADAKKARKKLTLARPPRQPKEKPWWNEYYTQAVKVRDRELFSA